MVSKKALKIGAAGVAVSAVAIGLGVGLSKKNAANNQSTSASQAMTMDTCRRLIDGRYESPTNDVFERRQLRDLQWGNDGYAAAAGGGGSSKGSFSGGSKSGGSKSGSKSGGSPYVSKGSFASPKSGGSKSKGSSYAPKASFAVPKSGGSKSKGSPYAPAVCSKGSKGMYPAYDPCAPVQYVPCDCMVAVSKGSSPKSPFGSKGYMPKSGGSKSGGSPFTSKGSSPKSGGSKSGGSPFTSKGSSKSGGGSKSGAAAASGGKPAWRSDGFDDRELQWGSDGYAAAAGGSGGSKSGGSKSGGSKASFSGGSKSGGSKSGGTPKASPYAGSKASPYKASPYSGSKGSSYKASPYAGSKGSFYKASPYKASPYAGSKGSATGTCMCAVSTISKGSKGSNVSGGMCTCLAPAMSKSKGSKGSTLVPVACPCTEPQPVAPSICEPTPAPTPKPVPFLTVPTTPAPTPCDAQRFFFINGVCTNDMFLLGGTSYGSAMECCNVNYGSGSMLSGNCNYVDTCNTPVPTPPEIETPAPTVTTPAPTPCEAQVFFFDGNSCTNEFFIADASSYNSVVMCCNANFGSGSFINGSCDYTDVCNTPPPTPAPFLILTNPPTTGSTPTVSTEVTGPPTVSGRGENDQGDDNDNQ